MKTRFLEKSDLTLIHTRVLDQLGSKWLCDNSSELIPFLHDSVRISVLFSGPLSKLLSSQDHIDYL